MNDGLVLTKIKDHLRVTWDYQDDDIKDMIAEGKDYIEGIAGPTDFTTVGLAFYLLKNYCRYNWSGSGMYFEQHYRSDLLKLQLKNAVTFRRSFE